MWLRLSWFANSLVPGRFEALLLNARDEVVDQSSLAPIAHRLLDASLQKNIEDFFMLVSDHLRAVGLVFCTNTSKHCGIIENAECARHEDIRRAITEGLDCGWSLPDLVANHNSPVGGSSGSSAVVVGIPFAQACLGVSAALSIELVPFFPLINSIEFFSNSLVGMIASHACFSL